MLTQTLQEIQELQLQLFRLRADMPAEYSLWHDMDMMLLSARIRALRKQVAILNAEN